METRAHIPENTLHADHEKLTAMLTEIKDVEPDLASGALTRAAASDKIKAIFAKLHKEMLPHLAQEERTIGPLVKEHFTKQEENEIVETIVKNIPSLELEMCLICDVMNLWAPQEVVDDLESNIPWIVRKLRDHIWMPRYLATKKQWMMDLLDPSNEAPVEEDFCATGCPIM